MATIDEKVGKKPSVHVSETDFENAEEVGYEKKPPSTAMSEALEDSVKLKEIRNQKKEELQNQIEDIRKTCRLYGISFSEIK